MPTLTVRFQGLCLFAGRSKTQPSGPMAVLLPDARKAKKFKDGSMAGDAHSPLLLRREAGIWHRLAELNRTVISFGGLTPGPESRDLRNLADIGAMASDFRLAVDTSRPDPRLVAWTVLDGGHLVTVNDPTKGKEWHLDRMHPLSPGLTVLHDMAIRVEWRAPFEDVLTVNLDRIETDPTQRTSFPFTTDAELCIGNVCGDAVMNPDVGTIHNITPGEFIPDYDFKWYYELFESTMDETIEVRVRKTAAGVLPVPRAHLPLAPAPAQPAAATDFLETVSADYRRHKDTIDTPTCLSAFYQTA